MERPPIRSLPDRLHPLVARLRREESGIALMEVVASAALLAVVAVGVLSGFDVAGSTSGNNKARAVAASIAQDDQERMRGLEIRTLITRGTETRTVRSGSVTYTVRSTADVRDDSANAGCTTGSGGIDYLKITSTVTWPRMRIQPVVAESLMAPRPGAFGPNEGGFAVQIIDRAGQPLAGVSVSLQGAASYNDTTDESGCAFFTYVTAGSYTVRFSQPGYVTPGGVTAIADPVSVPKGAVGNKVFEYDRAASLTLHAVTRVPGASADQADPAGAYAVAHSRLPAPGVRFFQLTSPAASFSIGPELFPFSNPYTAYAGACVGAAPDEFGHATPTVQLDPAGSGSQTVFEPAIDVRVLSSTGSGVAGATVFFDDDTCGSPLPTQTTNVDGRIANPGQPYGVYNLCAEKNFGTTSSPDWRRVRISGHRNDDPAGKSPTMVLTSSTGTAGSRCP